MPLLRYRCNSCGKEFAKIFFTPENAPRQCPVCHADNPEELGEAFEYDQDMMRRVLCTSCESCESCESDGGSCSATTSSS